MAGAQRRVWFISEETGGWSEAIAEYAETGLLLLPIGVVTDNEGQKSVREFMPGLEPLETFVLGEFGPERQQLSGIGYLLPPLLVVDGKDLQEFLVGVFVNRFDSLPFTAGPPANEDQGRVSPIFELTPEQIDAIGTPLKVNELPAPPIAVNTIDRKSGLALAEKVIAGRFGPDHFERWQEASGLRRLLEGVELEEEDEPQPISSDPDEELPRVWVCQYKPGDRVETWTRGVAAGEEILWKTGRKSLPKAAQGGDMVLYWRGVRSKEDPGGIVGTGVLVDPTLTPDEQGVNRFRTQVTEFFDDLPIPRKTVQDRAGLSNRWPGQGAFIPVKPESVRAINELLEESGRATVPPSYRGSRILELVSDTPASAHDYLNRSALAFMVAAHLNRVWNLANLDDAAEGRGRSWWSRLRSWLPSSRSSSRTAKLDEAVFGRPGFVMHVDAPWGGGKSTFANYLVRILNRRWFDDGVPEWLEKLPLNDQRSWPEEFRRPWHVVSFNAWQHQHLDPPWWSFYQAIRRQCFGGILRRKVATEQRDSVWRSWVPRTAGWLAGFLHWLFLWTMEILWRVFSPKILILLLTFGLTVAAAWELDQRGLLQFTEFSDVPGETGAEGGVVGFGRVIAIAVVIAVGGGSAIWSVFSVLTESLLPGTPSAARNYSLGSGDPLERFRRHFHFMMTCLRRPILVVVDDIDRCRPEVVVELVRGMQTILRSPRVIFLVLGDLDWISKAFETQHEVMKDIEVGAEHTFGGRFVEKAFQMSLVLPSIEEQTQKDFVGRILGVAGAGAAEVEGLDLGSIEQALDIEDPARRERRVQGDQNRIQSEIAGKGADEETQARVMAAINLKVALRNAGDSRSKEVTQHRLVGIAKVLPPNPRQIKRIVNGITLYQEVGRIHADIQPESETWRKLALWIVLMTEWPTTWNRLSNYPGLVDRARNGSGDGIDSHLLPSDPSIAEHLATEIRQDRAVWNVLAFQHEDGDDWPATDITSGDILMLRTFIPPSGSAEIPEPAEAENGG